MPQSRAEQITENFYAWEQRGRGWHVFSTPVELEPEFVPFFPVFFKTPLHIDEGHRPSIFTKAYSLVKDTINPKQEKVVDEAKDVSVQAYPFQSEESIESFSISFPKGEKPFKSIDIERFLTMLSTTNSLVCFEIVAWNDLIRLQFVCRASDTHNVEAQARAYFPTVIIQSGTSYISNILEPNKPTAILDLGMEEEFMRPIASTDRLDSDPLTGLYGILDNLQGDEQAVIQILFKGTVNPWAQSIISSVTDGAGESTFSDAPEMPKLAIEKISAPLFAVSMRVIAQDSSFEKATIGAYKIASAISQCSQSGVNKLIVLDSTYYNTEEHFADILYRRSHRAGMLLSAKELSTFVHHPLSISAKRLETDIKKTKRAPNIAWGHEFCLGTNRHQDFEGILTLSTEQRLKHMHVIGATGTGKSTLLQSCIVQDIHLGNGVAVLDPHGDLIESILPYIPESRIQDVILIDPADGEYPVGFNILTAHSDIEKEILASDLVSVFRRLSTSFGDQMHSVLANAILAFLESSTGGTLMDLRRFLIEKEFRNEFLKTVSDQSVIYYWQKEYPLLKTSSIGPILTRLDSFLRPKLIRNMVAQKKSLDFEAIMDSKKILLIKLAQGLIGTENSYLLGTFFVSKIYQAAMARQIQSKTDRIPFYLYIDEFQNFTTQSMSGILSGTRKYGLGCILAHQDMSQLQKQDTELANAVVSNSGTRVCFRIGDIDAKRFADGFSSFEPQDIQNLGVGQAVARIERPEYDFTIETLQLTQIPAEQGDVIKKAIIDYSRNTYSVSRSEIDQIFAFQQTGEDVTTEKQPISDFDSVKEINEPKLEIEQVHPVEITDGRTKNQLIEHKELTEHRYMQMYIKKMAEERGYVAKIEQPTDNGGRVDVLLEKNKRRIACEIGFTTTLEWEAHNVIKCLEEGYDLVVAITTKPTLIPYIQREIQDNLSKDYHSRIMVCEPQSLLKYLDKEAMKEATTETRIKGYRVKVEYSPTSEDENKSKSEVITKVVVDSLRKQNQNPYAE